ncbi:MAG: hypothetical protein M3220_04410 [Chloroflexota bacterium]|nr:hypothetical protein [Chloroflexota bacterium]
MAIVWRTLLAASRRDVVAWHIGFAALFLLIAVSLGVLLSSNKGTGFLGRALLPVLAAHAVLMIGGWLSLTLAGVAPKLVAMFTLTEDLLDHHLLRAQLGLLSSGIGGLAVVWGWELPDGLALVMLVLIAGGAGCLLWQLVTLYRHRRRRLFDVHAPFMKGALLFGVVGLLVMLANIGKPPGSPGWIVAGWLFLAGWLGTAVQGFFYKVVSFLLWLHRYAPIAGQQPTPRLEDLYHPHLAMAGFALWMVGIATTTLGLALGNPEWTRLATFPVTAGGLFWLGNILLIILPHRSEQIPVPWPK